MGCALPEKTAFVFSQDNEVCNNLKFLAGPQFGLSYKEVPNPSSYKWLIMK